MRLILHRLPNNTYYLPIWYERLFQSWLWANNLHPDDKFKLTYNSCYHFYDLSLFETKYGGDSHIQPIINFLIREGYNVEKVGSTWRYEYTYDDKDKRIAHRIDGVRIWINLSV